MSTIRKQSLISSGVVYLGFGLGAINTLLFARWLTPAQNGLVIGMFVSIGNIMYPIATMGMPSVINRFYPYYKDDLPAKKNDLMSIAFFLTLAAFLLVVLAGLVFKPLVIRKFGNNSELLVHYYYWVFPFGLGLSLLYVLEAYGWQLRSSVLTSLAREVILRLFNLILILLLFLGILGGFDIFVKFYSFTYLGAAAILVFYLSRKGGLHLVFSLSKVTKEFLEKIKSLIMLAWSANVVLNLSLYFAQLVIAAVVPGGLASVAIFTIGQYIASLIMAPMRGVAAAGTGPLSQAWKEQDHERIRHIYQRSSLNLLIFAVGMFILIAINFRDGILTFGLNRAYLGAETVFIIIGLNRVIDMGTGLNTQIIGTSEHWGFDFRTGMFLVALTIPLNYLLAKRMGIVGPAVADIVTFSLYNGIRCAFLYRKYGFQPFNRKTFYTLIIGIVLYFGCRSLFGSGHGLVWMIVRSTAFLCLYGGAVLTLRLSDDVLPVWQTIRKRFFGPRTQP
jgi:O-antigen/teichoic acid export membrane protein